MEDYEWSRKIEAVRARCVSHGGITTEDIERALLHVNGSVGQAMLILMLKEKEVMAPEGQTVGSNSRSTSPLLQLFNLRKEGDNGASKTSNKPAKLKNSTSKSQSSKKKAPRPETLPKRIAAADPLFIDVEDIPSPVAPPNATLALSKPTAFKINLKKKKSNYQTYNQKLERRSSELSEDLFEKRPPRTSDTFPNSSEDEAEEPEVEVEFVSDQEESEKKEESAKKEENNLKKNEGDEDDFVQSVKMEPPSSTQQKKPSPPKRMAQTRMTIFSKENESDKEGEAVKGAKKGKKRRRENEWPEPGFDGFEDPNAALYHVVAKKSRSLVMKNGRLTSVPNE